MEIWLSVESAFGSSVAVAVEFEPHHTVEELAAALAARVGVSTTPAAGLYACRQGSAFDVWAALDPMAKVADIGLQHGDRLSVGLPRVSGEQRQSGHGPALVQLQVVGGPAHGTLRLLAEGDHLVGRGDRCSVAIDDEALSREHFMLAVRREANGVSVRVRDVGSSNGTFIGGVRVEQATPVASHTRIEAGHSLFAVASLTRTAGNRTSVAGTIPFNRPPRMRPQTPDRVFKLDAPPEAAQPRRLSPVSIVSPLIIGLPMLMMGLMSRSSSGAGAGSNALIALGIASIVGSLVMAIFSWYEDRRSGSKAFDAQKVEFYESLGAVVRKLQAAKAEEVEERRRLSPNASVLITRARTVAPELWERRPDDGDFLSVSLGWADQASSATVEIADGGDGGLRNEALAAVDAARRMVNVPVRIDLARFGVLGLCGGPEQVESSARWVAVQLATLHSPRDLVLAAALAADEAASWSWMMWLPHMRSESSPIDGTHLAVGEQAASSLFEAVNSLIRARREARGSQLNDAKKPLPAVVLLLSERLRVPRSAVTRLLEDGAGVGVYTVWLGSTAEALPGECGVIANVRSSPATVQVSMPNLGTTVPAGALDELSIAAAQETALLLAPIRDVTAGGVRGQVSRMVALPSLLELSPPTPAAVEQMWQAQPFGVRAPIGIAASGPFEIDMRHDGPHALVGGTTGAGKSELLQTIVAALAASHPPSRLTFLLVDYKGGAAFKDAVHLPHTVGFVTDLDGHLVHRALVSLNAELRYREHLMRDFGVKDLIEMERRFPEQAPPTLLLVVDEFASLAKELPEFVDGVVNVAQRGRALGIHMILATQRPAGSINDNIRANTNLRIALRFNDETDSRDVIGQRDAALLPRSLSGRAFARLGQADLTEFQVAYAGGHTARPSARGAGPLSVHDIRFGEVQRARPVPGTEHDLGPTDLQVLVEAIRAAAARANIPPQRPPWLPALPPVLSLREIGPAARDVALLGLADLPDEQAQRPRVWDLETEGNLLVFGASGTGKTTLLRAVAVDLAQRHTPDEIHLYGLDFATRGLKSLSALPHTGSVVNGDDIERVQRLVVMIEREIARRKNAFAEVGASTLSEFRRSGGSMARIVVLLDSYSGFTSTFEKVDFGEWIERVTRLVGEGRPLGIHWVITADRRTAIGLTLLTTVGNRVVLRMADDDEYTSLGIDGRIAKAAALPPGRCFIGSSTEVQLVLAGDDPTGDGQSAFIETEGARLSSLFPAARVPRVGSLPTMVPFGDIVQPGHGAAAVGIGQSDLSTVSITLRDGDLLVAGPSRSGRSTALAALARSLSATTPDAELIGLFPRRTPLTDLSLWSATATDIAQCEELLQRLLERMADRTGDESPIVVVLDDGNELTDTSADGHLERVLRRGRDCAVHVVAAAEAAGALRSYGGWIPQIRKDRRALLLNPDPDIDGDLVGVRLPRRSGGGLPPGRGYLCLDGVVELVQVPV